MNLKIKSNFLLIWIVEHLQILYMIIIRYNYKEIYEPIISLNMIFYHKIKFSQIFRSIYKFWAITINKGPKKSYHQAICILGNTLLYVLFLIEIYI